MTNPTPSQSARDAAADVALQIYGARVSDGIRSGAIKYHHLIDATHAAEQRGMEKAAGIAMDDAKFREGSLQEEAALRIAAAIRKAKEGV